MASDITGYPSLAAFVASDRDRSTAIYKRFDRLAARNLLYLQSELAELQWKQDGFDKEDRNGDMNSLQAARNWSHFKKRADADPSRLELVKEIRATLKEYREALLFESTSASIPSPEKKIVKAFQSNFYNGDLINKAFPTLGGHSETIYDDIDDLVALRVVEQQDRLSLFVQDHLGFLFTETSRNGNVGYVSGYSMARFIAWFSTALAALLLIGAILVLYKVQSPDLRLGLIALFTALFAASVGLLTNARRAELFGATAAYAAVLVVFVSGNLGATSTAPSH